jgi:hypothetical protein
VLERRDGERAGKTATKLADTKNGPWVAETLAGQGWYGCGRGTLYPGLHKRMGLVVVAAMRVPAAHWVEIVDADNDDVIDKSGRLPFQIQRKIFAFFAKDWHRSLPLQIQGKFFVGKNRRWQESRCQQQQGIQ